MGRKLSAKKPAPLDPYRAKRDFKITPEPAPKRGEKTGWSFVIQEHHARSHHFDLRLEIDGVLVSWAVPKGVPEFSADNRLAVHVEDHPVSYGNFEGEIPAGNYGAGLVSIWDRGDWEPLGEDWRRSFEKGKLKFVLHGKRLDGPFLLARMKEPNWLLRWLDPATHPLPASSPHELEEAVFIAPQLARPVATVPTDKGWIHEIKYDGYRLIAVRRHGKVRLYTRNHLDWTTRFSSLAQRLEKLEGGDFVLDGEAVVFDGEGRSRFGALQGALKSGDGKHIAFVAFDLLHAAGRNLRHLPLSERIIRMAEIVPAGTGLIRRSESWQAAVGPDLFRQACKLGLEGIISKQSSARYQPGSRRDWVKSKCRPRQEFVICGYTPPKNSCPAFGALVLGSYENGKLVPRGKVGTGFSDHQRRSLLKQMEHRAVERGPFPAETGVTWIVPELVAEVEFAELTEEGSIRQGSFVSLRDDKPSGEVRLDAVDKASADPAGAVVAGITISHPERIVFPEDDVGKLEIARYYERVGDLIMPHLVDRPLALLRAPDGITGQMFFQKSFKGHVPPQVKVGSLKDGTAILSIKSLKGLISLVQFGAIEFHPWGATLPNVEKPDLLVWDLDPDKSVPWRETLGAAFLLRDFLAERGLQTQVKTSGGKGLHVMLFLRRLHGWDLMKPFAKAVAAAVADQNPGRFTIQSSIAKRGGKIYIDWLRNGRGATCIAPWALRARTGAGVSRPLDWADLANLDAHGFTLREPFHLPAEWKSITPQSISKVLIKELGQS